MTEFSISLDALSEVADIEEPVIGLYARTVTCGEQKLMLYDGKHWLSVLHTPIKLNGVNVPCSDVIDLYILKDKTIPLPDQKVTKMMVEYIAFHSDPGSMFVFRFDASEKYQVCVPGEGTEYITFTPNQ